MDVEVVEHEEDSASAGRGEGGADGRAPARPSGGDGRALARPSDAAASAARQASAGDITRMVLALGEAARAEQPRGDQTRGGAAAGGSTDDAAGVGEGQQGSGTHLAGQVAVAGDGSLMNIGELRTSVKTKKTKGSAGSVLDVARRVREWGIHKPPGSKHSAWGWAFKYKNCIKGNPAGYEHHALCSVCLQAQDLEAATVKLGKSDSPTALMQHLEHAHPEAYAQCYKLEQQRKNPPKRPSVMQSRRSPRKHQASGATSRVDAVRTELNKLFAPAAPSSSKSQASATEEAAARTAPEGTQRLHAHLPHVEAPSEANKGPAPGWQDLLVALIAEEFLPLSFVQTST